MNLAKIFVTLGLFLILFGCTGGNQNSTASSLIGTWSNQESGIKFSFDGQKFIWINPDGTQLVGTYAATDKQITTIMNGTTVVYTYLIQGNQLGIKDQSGNGIMFTKTSDAPTTANASTGFTTPLGNTEPASNTGTAAGNTQNNNVGNESNRTVGNSTESETASGPCNALTDCLWIEANQAMAYSFYNGQFQLQIQNNRVQGTYTINGNSLVLNDGQKNYNYTFTINANGRDMTLIDTPTKTPIYFKGITLEEAQQLAGSQ